MFRLVHRLTEIVKAGHLAYPMLASTGIHTTLLVALGMVVVGTSEGPRREAVPLAIGLGSSTAASDGELDATSIAADEASAENQGAAPPRPAKSDFAAVDMQPAGISEGESADDPRLVVDLPASHDVPGLVDHPSTGQQPARQSSISGSATAKQGSGASSGKSGGKGGKPGGKLAAKGTKNSGQDSAGGAGGSSFFGLNADGNRVVFVLDVSGSMHGRRMRRAQKELRHTLESLKPSQKFYIVFFSDGALPMPAAGLLSATSDNVAQAWQWVQQAQCGGGTNPLPALLLALELKPDAIYLMTDGKFSGQVLLAATQDPPGHRTPVNTIAFASKKAERLLQAIANETGGSYRFVP
jgi:Mg-chelatase subunit ChlD